MDLMASIEDDVDRVSLLVQESGDPEHADWLGRWADGFDAATADEDEGLCEDLCDALIVYERTMLRPCRPEDYVPVDALIRELGFVDLLDNAQPEVAL